MDNHFVLYCNVSPVFGFSSAKYDLNLIKSYLLPVPVNERNLEPTLIQKAEQFISFNFCVFQSLHIRKPHETQQVLILSWRHTNFQTQEDFSPTNDLITLTKCRIQNLSRIMLSTVNLAVANLLKPSRRTMLTYWIVHWHTEQAVIKLKLSKPPPTGIEKFRIIITCYRYGGKNKWTHSRTFCVDITITMLYQLRWECKKWLLFATTKISICWSLVVLYQTWLPFV